MGDLRLKPAIKVLVTGLLDSFASAKWLTRLYVNKVDTGAGTAAEDWILKGFLYVRLARRAVI